MNVKLSQVVYWGVGALALLALASAMPDVATMLAIILIAGVLLTHWQDYASIFSIDYINTPGAK